MSQGCACSSIIGHERHVVNQYCHLLGETATTYTIPAQLWSWVACHFAHLSRVKPLSRCPLQHHVISPATAAAAAAAASSALVFSSAGNRAGYPRSKRQPKPSLFAPSKSLSLHRRAVNVLASLSAPELQHRSRSGGARPDDLVSSILSKVTGTDRGVSLSTTDHKRVGEIAQQLQKYCVDAPVKCPLIFGDWDVLYCSNPTSPGGGYRSALGRLIFKTKEMIQVIDSPDVVKNKVAFRVLGFLDGHVSLKGKLKALDESWIQVVFEPPELKVGGFEFKYGGESEVKLQIIYIDERIRLGMGSRGSLFVFQRRE